MAEDELKRLAEEVIARQKQYRMNLARNEDFEKWTKSGWEDAPGYDSSLGEPKWPKEIEELWKKDILSIDDLSVSIPPTYEWRVRIGISEKPLQPEKPKLSNVDTCPGKTLELAMWYEAYIVGNYGDTEAQVYIPILAELISWMEQTYGQPSA